MTGQGTMIAGKSPSLAAARHHLARQMTATSSPSASDLDDLPSSTDLTASSSCGRVEISTTGNSARVYFGTITAWEFPPTIGDNPSVSAGVPVALGHSPTSTVVIDIDAYEKSRKPRRTTRQLKIDCRAREEMLLLAGFDMNEILLAVKHARLWTASSKSKTQSSSSPIRSSAGKSAGMIHRKLARIMSTTCSPLNASNKSLRRGSLIASRVDELVDDAENRWAADPRANKAPPCGRRRRGSMNTARVSGSGDDSMPLVRERVMRRCSSEMNLSNRNDRREQHRWDESIASRRPGFWSSTKDSCVLSPKPALRRGSVQTHSQWNETKRYGNEDAEAPATTEADMLHYYQYGEATAQRDSVAENPTRATRQWSLKSNQQRGVGATQGGDVTPRPRSRRVSMDTGDAPSAPARRRSSFFGANGVSSENRDIQPSPTQRRSSICNDDPFQTQECQGSGTIDGNNRVEIDSGNSSTRIHRGPIRRISIIPLSWGLKSERDDTESMAGSISSTPSDIRRASNRTSVSGLFLGPVLSLDHGYAPDIDLLAVDLPHRSLFGGSHTSGTSEMEPTLNDVTIALRPRRRASMQELGPGHPSKQSSRFRDSSLLSSSTSSSGSQVSRRASFFGSILPLRDVLSGSVP